jgi:hypothetical protein
MAVVKKWTCDGCGATTETDVAAETCSFYQAKVTLGAWGKDILVCTKCHDRILENIDPEKWPRYSPVAERAA